MFKDTPAFSSFSVNDLAAAKTFYGETLGLTVEDQPDMGFNLQLNGTKVFVYAKPDHQPASFTVLNLMVSDIDKAVDGLIAKGVQMEHYDEDQMKTDEKGIARSPSPDQGPTIAWFKDPAGNVLSVLTNV
jgi:catechol 2,3-dioxygenase-like lactoylglutathione lyase family enzyme